MLSKEPRWSAASGEKKNRPYWQTDSFAAPFASNTPSRLVVPQGLMYIK